MSPSKTFGLYDDSEITPSSISKRVGYNRDEGRGVSSSAVAVATNFVAIWPLAIYRPLISMLTPKRRDLDNIILSSIYTRTQPEAETSSYSNGDSDSAGLTDSKELFDSSIHRVTFLLVYSSIGKAVVSKPSKKGGNRSTVLRYCSSCFIKRQ